MTRKLLALASLLTVAEFAALLLLLQTFLGGVVSGLGAAMLALAPNLLMVVGPWAIYAQRWSRGLRNDAGPETTREEMIQLPRRVLFVRTIATTVLTLILAPIVATRAHLPAGAAGVLAGVTIAIAFAFNNLRSLAYRRVIDGMAAQYYASDPLRYQARTLRERLFVAANVLGIFGTAAAAVFSYFIVEAPMAELVATSALFPTLIAVLATAFGIDIFRTTGRLIAWAARAPGADVARAFTASAVLPYRLALGNLICWTFAAIALGAIHGHTGAVPAAVAQVFAGIVSVGCGTVMYQAVWHHRILTPLRERAAAEIVESEAAIPRGRLSIRSQLLLTFLLLLGFGGAFAFATIDAEHERLLSGHAALVTVTEHGMLGPASTLYIFAVLLAAAAGVIWLVSNELADPIRALERHARRLGRGELDEPIPAGSADEVGSLANALETSRRSLKQTLSEVRSLNATLEERVQERTAELERTNAELARALRALSAAQEAVVGAEKLASLGRMSAGIAHEVNNPLNFVKNALPPLQRSIAELTDSLHRGAAAESEAALAEMKDVVQVMENGVGRMSTILRALLDFARQSPEARPEPFDLRQVIDSALALVRHELAGRVEVSVESDGVATIVGEPGPLGQALVNLVKNGAEAIAGPGRIAVRARRLAEAAEIDVQDSGAGMEPEVVQRAFEPFFTTKAVGQGTGLGLSVVHGIVQKHGGATRIRSAPGEGTTVTIVLPQKKLELE